MKTIITTGILSLLLIIGMSAIPLVETKNSPLQIKTTTVTPSFSFFRTHRQGRGITATWGLSSNAGVSEFVVRKTNEDPNDEYSVWDIVYSSPCEGLRSYKCTDNAVSPGLISYQVVAVMGDGSMIASNIITERIVSR